MRDLSQDCLGHGTTAATRKYSHDSQKQTNLRGNRGSSVQECLLTSSNLTPHKHNYVSVVAHLDGGIWVQATRLLGRVSVPVIG